LPLPPCIDGAADVFNNPVQDLVATATAQSSGFKDIQEFYSEQFQVKD